MKAIRVHAFGGPAVLKLEDVPTPRPAAGQVLIWVKAAGVNPYDTYMRNGTYAIKPPLPYTPGSDAAGTIEAVGDGVTRFKPGDRVYTANTLTGQRGQMEVDASPGLGEAAVSGAVKPDHWVVDGASGSAGATRVGDQRPGLRAGHGGGTEQLPRVCPTGQGWPARGPSATVGTPNALQ